MMRLPEFDYRSPDSVEEVSRILAGEGPQAMIVAGGTDLWPNMKRRHQQPKTVVSLRKVPGLRESSASALGAGVTLTEIAGAASAEGHEALRRAAAQVANPLLRNAATIGGNICLDTRCTYYDQNAEWRQAIDHCMKAEGETCWVAPSSPKCLAISSTDCAPALIALGSEVELVSAAEGARRVALEDLYKNDGIFYLKRKPDEVLTQVCLPERSGWTSTYWKLRRRGSIDFPVLGVAGALKLAGDVVEDARIVLGAVSSRPILVTAAADKLRGRALTDDLIQEVADDCAKLAKPMDNSDFTLHWRKAVVKPYVSGVLKQLRGDDPATLSFVQREAANAVG
jgi:4-hydroxybenzoyl-CoA reductase subunit beta